MSARGGPATPRGQGKKISSEDAEKLYSRLYEDSMNHHKITVQKLERKYYPVAKPDPEKQMNAEKLEEAIDRLAVKSVELRKKRLEDNERLHAKKEPGKKLSEEEMEESTRRLYNDSMRIRNETHKRLERKFEFHNKSVELGKTRKRTKEELAESAQRLAVPTKKEFNADEINKIYGFKETPRGKKWTPNGLIDPADAEEAEVEE